MKTLFKDSEKTLSVEGTSDGEVDIHFKNIYGEKVVRKYKFSEDFDMEDFLDKVVDDLNWWGLNHAYSTILDEIDDFLYEIGICY